MTLILERPQLQLVAVLEIGVGAFGAPAATALRLVAQLFFREGREFDCGVKCGLINSWKPYNFS